MTNSHSASRFKIFISHRRDCPSFLVTCRIVDRLKDRYGDNAIFFDVGSMKSGQKIGPTITRSIQNCSLFLAIIGPDWEGKIGLKTKRIHDRNDWIRQEIETAYSCRDVRSGSRKRPVIEAVLIGNESQLKNFVGNDTRTLIPEIERLLEYHAYSIEPDHALTGFPKLFDLDKYVDPIHTKIIRLILRPGVFWAVFIFLVGVIVLCAYLYNSSRLKDLEIIQKDSEIASHISHLKNLKSDLTKMLIAESRFDERLNVANDKMNVLKGERDRLADEVRHLSGVINSNPPKQNLLPERPAATVPETPRPADLKPAFPKNAIAVSYTFPKYATFRIDPNQVETRKATLTINGRSYQLTVGDNFYWGIEVDAKEIPIGLRLITSKNQWYEFFDIKCVPLDTNRKMALKYRDLKVKDDPLHDLPISFPRPSELGVGQRIFITDR